MNDKVIPLYKHQNKKMEKERMDFISDFFRSHSSLYKFNFLAKMFETTFLYSETDAICEMIAPYSHFLQIQPCQDVENKSYGYIFYFDIFNKGMSEDNAFFSIVSRIDDLCLDVNMFEESKGISYDSYKDLFLNEYLPKWDEDFVNLLSVLVHVVMKTFDGVGVGKITEMGITDSVFWAYARHYDMVFKLNFNYGILYNEMKNNDSQVKEIREKYYGRLNGNPGV